MPTLTLTIYKQDGVVNNPAKVRGMDTKNIRFGVAATIPLKYGITAVNTGTETFTIAGDSRAVFPATTTFTVTNSTGNNGTWTVSSVALTGGNTVITVTGNITNATADGIINVNAKRV